MWYENHEDPAQNNPELLSKLQENREIGDEKLNEVFDEYTRKQEELNANGKPPDLNESDNDDEDSDNDDDDEEEEEDDEGDDERHVSVTPVVDINSDSDATDDPEADLEKNGVQDSKVEVEEKKLEEELEIIEPAGTSGLTKTNGSNGSKVVEENLASTSKQVHQAPSSISDNLNDNSKGW